MSIRSFLLLAFIMLLNANVIAQANDFDAVGYPSFGSFHGSEFDTVLLQNGNLHFEIPLFSITERGQTLTWKYIYDTQRWTVHFTPMPNPQDQNYGVFTVKKKGSSGLRFSYPYSWGAGYHSAYKETCTGYGWSQEFTVTEDWYVRDPSGTEHPVPLRVTQGVCPGPAGNGEASDGSGIFLNVNATDLSYIGRLPNGTQFTGGQLGGPGGLTDSNGNVLGPNDYLGRNPLTVTNGTTGGATYTDYGFRKEDRHGLDFL